MITLTTGATRISYTNQNNGKTIKLNVSGPGKITVYPDGSSLAALKGHSAVFPPARPRAAVRAAHRGRDRRRPYG